MKNSEKCSEGNWRERRVLGFGLGTKGKERKVRECGNEVFVVEIWSLYMGKE